jgi:hypothetical protein
VNRRQMMILPGVAALAASDGLARPTSTPTGGSRSQLKKLSRPKSLYKIPKNEAKTTKYLGRVAPLLDLTADQQEHATAIFKDAILASSGVRSNLKTARLSLADAVKNGNRGLIEQISAMIGSLQAQRHAIGANANAAFLETLNQHQRIKLSEPKN